MPSLKEYLEKVDKKEVLIPRFQRDFIWQTSSMVKLLSSVLKNYPIGSFLIMENLQNYACGPVKGHDDEKQLLTDDYKQKTIILDGQQRTTTLYQALYGKGEYRFYLDFNEFYRLIFEDKESIDNLLDNNLEDLIICLQKGNKKNPRDYASELTEGYFPLSRIFDKHEDRVDYNRWLLAYVLNKSNGKQNQQNEGAKINSIFINKLLNNVISFQTNEIVIPGKTSANVVCTIFETINSTGVKLTIIDLLNAKCYPSGFYINPEIKETIEKNPIFENFEKDNDPYLGSVFLKIISLLSNGSCQRSDLLKLSVGKNREEENIIRDTWETAIGYCLNAIEYFKNNFGVIGIKYFPYKDMLSPFAVIINSKSFDINNQTHREKLNKLYWRSVFSNYFSNASDSKSALIVKEMCGFNDPNGKVINCGWLDDDNQFPTVVKNTSYLQTLAHGFEELDKATTQSALYKAVLNLLILNNAPDFTVNHSSISGLSENDLNDHHIFPKNTLSSFGIKGSEANTILNRTLISDTANRIINTKAPTTYFMDDKIISQPIKQDLLDGHFLDVTFLDPKYANAQFNKANFEKFKQDRKAKIVAKIKSLLYMKGALSPF